MSASGTCVKPSVRGAYRADMSRSDERLATFHNIWRHHKVLVAELVESGFFRPDKAEADVVVCYYCGVALDQWKENDSVQKEHLRETRTSRGRGLAFAQYVRKKAAPKVRLVGFQRRLLREKVGGWATCRSRSPDSSEPKVEQAGAGGGSLDVPTV